MMTEAALRPRLAALLTQRRQILEDLDRSLLVALVAIVGLGLVMVASSSVAVAEQSGSGPLHMLLRQLMFLPLGLLLASLVLGTPLARIEAYAGPLMLAAVFLLLLVLVPGVGREVNGAVRWIPVGPVNVQVSEVARVLLLVFVASHLSRHAEAVRHSLRPLFSPALVLGITGVLLLAQPDFGALAILAATVGAMIFIAGVPLGFSLGISTLGGLAGMALMHASPYRLERLIAFRDPWADPFDSGFQLTQSLIAVGRGEWFGVGLGNSVQKLFYLPEAHTDFVFAVLAEELGVVGMTVVIGLYAFVVLRACLIGGGALRSGNLFAGLLACGIGVSLGLQAFVNMGVNLGLLPTKGLTLPLMSYGGSSLIMTLVAMGLLLRIDYEQRRASRAASQLTRTRRVS
nr:putative lipid II flippase FtsW [Spiribacter sp. 2438]